MSVLYSLYERLLMLYIENRLIDSSIPLPTVGNNDLIETDFTHYTTTRKDFQNPDNNMGINFANTNKLLWIYITSISVKEQIGSIIPGRPPVIEDEDTIIYTFKFLAPIELVETISHSWEPYESIGGAIQQLVGSTLIKGKSVVDALISMGHKEGDKILKAVTADADIIKTINQVTSTTLGEERAKPWRVDTPLMYKNTERRTYEFPFNLISLQGKPYDEVVEPVKLLERLSSPSTPINRQPWDPSVISPYVFRIYTMPYSANMTDVQDRLIRIPYAALKNVNPVWRGPFVDGYPTRCELRLTFQEIEPVFASSFITKTHVNVYTYPME